MSETIYVTGVVIANGVKDSDGDVLDKKDIKTILTKYLNKDTDTMHTNIRNAGVDFIENKISEVDTVIAGQTVPAGSWIATVKVTNPKLVECIQEGKLRGFSLGSVSEEAMTPKYWFINKSMNYRDLESIEEVIPLFVSFVDYPANQFDFEWMEYETYINKSNKSVDTMTEKKEDMIPVSFVEKLMDKLSITKSEKEETEEIEKADETVETTETSTDETVSALFEKLDTIIAQNEKILEGLNKAEEDNDEEIEKADDEESEADAETEEEEENKKSEENSEEDDPSIKKSETTEEETSEDEDDDLSIEKRQTHKFENQSTEVHSDFYSKTGRDSFGRKLRN